LPGFLVLSRRSPSTNLLRSYLTLSVAFSL
jgi:hypothetical protein